MIGRLPLLTLPTGRLRPKTLTIQWLPVEPGADTVTAYVRMDFAPPVEVMTSIAARIADSLMVMGVRVIQPQPGQPHVWEVVILRRSNLDRALKATNRAIVHEIRRWERTWVQILRTYELTEPLTGEDLTALWKDRRQFTVVIIDRDDMTGAEVLRPVPLRAFLLVDTAGVVYALVVKLPGLVPVGEVIPAEPALAGQPARPSRLLLPFTYPLPPGTSRPA